MDKSPFDKTDYQISNFNVHLILWIDLTMKSMKKKHRGPGDTLLTWVNMAVTDQLFGIKYKIQDFIESIWVKGDNKDLQSQEGGWSQR